MSHFDASTISLNFIVGVDSNIEGLALGIIQKWSKVIAILIAIVAHKPVKAFAVTFKRPSKSGFLRLTAVVGDSNWNRNWFGIKECEFIVVVGDY
jgi:hypothetical protein